MASRSMELAIRTTNDTSAAVDGFQDAGRAAIDMSDSVEKASRTTQEAAGRMDNASSAADNMASTSSKATGAMSAMAGGLEAVGLEKYAAGLQTAAVATDFLSGVGDAANLILEKSAIVTKAQAAATKVATLAQRALNFAFVSSPIGLIVLAVVALVAILVVAYKKSETFRKIVDAAFSAVQTAASAAFGWIKDHWPLLLAIITGPIGLAVLAVVKNWEKIKTAASAAFGFFKTTFLDAIDAITAPIKTLIDFVQDLLDKIGSIHLPHVDLNPFGRAVGGGGRAGGFVSTGGRPGGFPVIQVNGALDPNAVAVQINDIILGRARRLGTS